MQIFGAVNSDAVRIHNVQLAFQNENHFFCVDINGSYRAEHLIDLYRDFYETI